MQTFTYDPAGNMRTASEGSSGPQTVVDYDEDQRMEQVTQGTSVTSYVYNSSTGRLDFMSTAAGTTAYAYDADGLLDSMTDPVSLLPTFFDWDSAARPATRSTVGGPAYAWGYDDAGRPSSLDITQAATSLASFDLSYDASGNVTSKDATVAGAPAGQNGQWSYAYDGPGRLIEATDPTGEKTVYGYDGAGNRTSVKVGSAAAVTTTYSNGLPTSATGGITYTHDGAGNMTGVSGGGRTHTYAYDDWGRLTGVTGALGVPVASYAHDALGRVTTRTQGATTAALSYVGLSEDVASETGVQTTTYAHSPTGPLAQRTLLGIRFHVTDLHGDVVGLAGSLPLPIGGPLAGTKSFGPWGEVRAQSGETSPPGVPVRPDRPLHRPGGHGGQRLRPPDRPVHPARPAVRRSHDADLPQPLRLRGRLARDLHRSDGSHPRRL